MNTADVERVEAELGQLGARIDELRGARSRITYDLEWAIRERERLRRHLASLVRDVNHGPQTLVYREES